MPRVPMSNPSQPTTAFKAVADSMRGRIEAKEWQLGEMLPSTGSLRHEYQTSRTTILLALTLLVGEGLIERQRFKGTWLTEKGAAR